jgi:hypothetical protein
MKKQSSKRLTLHRETMRRISGGETGTATLTCVTCIVDCLTHATCTW